MLLAHVQPQPQQLLPQFSGRAFGGIGQEDISLFVLVEPGDEFLHAREQKISVVNDAVHVADKGLFSKKLFHLICPFVSCFVGSQAYYTVSGRILEEKTFHRRRNLV